MSQLKSRIAEFENLWGQPHPGRRLSEPEFDRWIGEKTRAEWIDGEIEMMAPASFEHDDLSGWLRAILRYHVEQHDLGVVLGPEILVRLAKVRQKRLPDVLFIAKDRLDIIHDNVIEGPPDLIVEIVSPESADRDWLRKYASYGQAGVREYWIIDPACEVVEAHSLSPTRGYRPLPEKLGAIHSRAIRGFFLKPEWLFASPRPKLFAILRELGDRQ
ncbi:MAG: Uma2 family endonuclease [Tepidisphaerales bacterium]